MTSRTISSRFVRPPPHSPAWSRKSFSTCSSLSTARVLGSGGTATRRSSERSSASRSYPPCVFRMRRLVSKKKWERVNLVAEPRSAYHLSGPARYEWEHSIPQVEALRYSITFRNMRED